MSSVTEGAKKTLDEGPEEARVTLDPRKAMESIPHEDKVLTKNKIEPMRPSKWLKNLKCILISVPIS
ncbi:hypothetical protein MASR2M48_02710 [Spirochaetota bacterium]